MSAFPQILWRPSPKDVVTEFAPRSVLTRIQLAGAVIQIAVPTPTNFIPVDQVLLLRHCAIQGDPAPAQTVNFLSLTIQQNAIIVCTLAQQGEIAGTPAADQPYTLGWQGELVLTSTEQLVGIANFDLGAANNNAYLSVGGILIPRGNWQR